MSKLNIFQNFEIKNGKYSKILGGLDPVETTRSSGYTNEGVYWEQTDGYNDDNNDGRKDMCESFYSNKTYYPCDDV